MSSSSPAPKIPLWAFILMDVVLLGAAGLIAARAPQPWTEVTMFAVAACVCVGGLLLLVPWLVYVERERNETLDERQRALEALARTVASSAEQISIAANGLNEIADITQKNVKHAEQLPHKLQEKIAEFQAQLANANENEREELEKELEELRSSETERLQTISERITRAAGDFAKLETATNAHLVAANEALAKLSMGTASAIGKAQAAAEQALAQARQEAARTIGDALGNAVQSIETTKAAAAGELVAGFERQIAELKAASAEVSTLIAKLTEAAKAAGTPPMPTAAAEPIVPPQSEVAAAKPEEAPQPAHGAPASEPDDNSTPAATTPASPPKRPRKQRREEPPAAEPTPAPVEPPAAPAEPVAEAPDAAAAEPATAAASTPTEAAIPQEPVPVLPETIAEVAPVAPATAQPFAEPTAAPEPASEAAVESPAAELPKPTRKRASKKPEDEQPALGLDLELPKENGDAAPGVVERVLSSDGATRLIVTAYIGIGNRLFIRGSGPGLSWDKGTPLQFVSIGKWRWETNDASVPVQFKLLKNDELESAGLGTLTIEPGHQHEVMANF